MPKEKSIKEPEDLPGIGPVAAEKLKASGITTLEKVATTSPHDLSEIAGISVENAKKAIAAAQEVTTIEFKTGEAVLKEREQLGKITTGSESLDTLIGGGVETKAITEVYGRFATGKSQLAFQLCLNVQLPKEKLGLEGNALFIDTEGSLPYDETVLLEVDGKIQFKKIGEVVEEAIKSAEEVREINGTISISENKKKIKVISFDPKTYKVGKFEITGFIKHPVKKIFKIKLASGREVKTTEYHNFFTLDGTGSLVPTYLKNLNFEEFVAVPALMPQANENNEISQEEAEFFGLYVAEGSMIPDNRYKTGYYLVIITSKNPKAEVIVKKFTQKRGLKYHRNRLDMRIYSKQLTEELKACYQNSPYNSHTKKIPEFVFNSPRYSQQWFLNGYLLGDGSLDRLTGTQNADTVSRYLADGLLYLTSSFGIPARNHLIFREGKKSRGGPSQTYNIHWIPNKLKDRTLELLPNNRLQIGNLLKKSRAENNLKQADIKLGKTVTSISQIETGIRNLVSRSKLISILSHFKKETQSIKKLKRIINSDIWFDKVVSIEETPEEACYDFEVLPGKKIENFVGGYGGIFLHNTFRPERIREMAKAKDMDPKVALENTIIVRVASTDKQILTVERAGSLIEQKNIKLIVIDSLTSLFRSEFIGRGALNERQQKLNSHIHKLQMLADKYKLAVYITNQVMDNPAILFGDPTTPIGGNIIAHAATTRLYIRKSKEDKRIVRLVDSPNMPDGECVIRITQNGIID